MLNKQYNVDGGVIVSDLKNRVRIGNAVDKKLFEKLKQLSMETMIPMSRLLDRGIELILREYEEPSHQ
jgi:hypothetical protein